MRAPIRRSRTPKVRPPRTSPISTTTRRPPRPSGCFRSREPPSPRKQPMATVEEPRSSDDNVLPNAETGGGRGDSRGLLPNYGRAAYGGGLSGLQRCFGDQEDGTGHRRTFEGR